MHYDNDAEFDPCDVDYYIESEESGTGYHGETLGTAGVGPCVGIALYNPVVARGDLGHFYPAQESVMSFIRATLSEDTSRVRVWLTGCAAMPEPNSRETTGQFRQSVVDHLLELGFLEGNILTVWVENPDQSANMLLDTGSGECKISVDDDVDPNT